MKNVFQLPSNFGISSILPPTLNYYVTNPVQLETGKYSLLWVINALLHFPTKIRENKILKYWSIFILVLKKVNPDIHVFLYISNSVLRFNVRVV